MAAISIISGTSLNAFFHPCENLQSTAIQSTWHSANLELLSCIAKTELYYQKAEKVGPGQRPLLSLESVEMGWKGAMGREAHSCDGWGGQAVFFWGDLHPRRPTGTSAAGAASAVRKISRALAQQPTLLKICCYSNCAMAGFPLLPAEEEGRLTKSLDILGIAGFIVSGNVWIGILSDDS